jgi:alpha-glucosidase
MKIIVNLIAIFLLLSEAIAVCYGQQVVVHSPDKNVIFKSWVSGESQLFYSVVFAEKEVIEPSPMKLEIEGVEITRNIAFQPAQEYKNSERYIWRGVHSTAVNNCNGAKIYIRNKDKNLEYIVEVRVYNDGAAFRFIVPGEGVRTPDESTVFTIPQKSIVWYHNLGGHYEGVYDKKDIADVKKGEWAAPPLTVKLPDKRGYISITEAALFKYSGMALQANGERGFVLALGHKHPISYPFRLRYSNDIDRVSKPAQVSGTITTPWRVVMIGKDLNALVNCDIVHNLAPEPDKTLFLNGIQTDWIKPGRAVWRYLDGGQTTLEAMKEFSRLAGELGFEYHVIEGFWTRWSDEQIKELVEYSKKHNVGLWFWKHSRQLRSPEEREEFFKKLRSLGVVGAKIDFFDHEHKDVVELYEELLKTAAKYEIMVNFHGANKPTGESRTYPNELTREAVRGMEASRLKERAQHNVILPFTRFLAGPADYTPVHFGQRRGDTTLAHQIATAIVFTSPLLTYAAHPTNLTNNPAVELIKSIPSVWDETIVLPESEIGELAVFARRSGKVWFVAVLNGEGKRSIKISPTFLENRKYKTYIVRDQPENLDSLVIERKLLTCDDLLNIECNSGGGLVVRFEPAE